MNRYLFWPTFRGKTSDHPHFPPLFKKIDGCTRMWSCSPHQSSPPLHCRSSVQQDSPFPPHPPQIQEQPTLTHSTLCKPAQTLLRHPRFSTERLRSLVAKTNLPRAVCSSTQAASFGLICAASKYTVLVTSSFFEVNGPAGGGSYPDRKRV